MRVNFNVNLKDYKGDPVLFEDKTEITLKKACIIALLQGNSTIGDKVKRHDLVERIYHAEGPAELTIDELKVIKDLVIDGWPVGVVGPVVKLLEKGNEDVK